MFYDFFAFLLVILIIRGEGANMEPHFVFPTQYFFLYSETLSTDQIGPFCAKPSNWMRMLEQESNLYIIDDI